MAGNVPKFQGGEWGSHRHSDHRPLLIDTGVEPVQASRGDGGFRFEAAWVGEEPCRAVVKDAWERSAIDGQRPVHMTWQIGVPMC